MHTLHRPAASPAAAGEPPRRRTLWRWAPVAATVAAVAVVVAGIAAGHSQRAHDERRWTATPAEVTKVDLSLDDGVLRADARVRTADGLTATVRERVTRRPGDATVVWRDRDGTIFTPVDPGEDPLTNPTDTTLRHAAVGGALVAAGAAGKRLAGKRR